MTATSIVARSKLQKLDGRTLGARRRLALIEYFTNALGGRDRVSPLQATDIRRAADLVALAEETRARALRDGPVSFDMQSLVRLEGAADRAVRRLDIKPGNGVPEPSLADHLAKRAAKADEQPPGEAA